MDVSVLIPTFRRPRELRVCLESIVASQLCPAEVIVGDDGGDVETLAVCESFKEFFPLVHLTPSGPGSLAANLTRLVAQAKSPWSYLLHDDDFMVGNHRELLAGQHDSCDLLFTDHWVCNAYGVIDEAQSERNSAAYTRSSLAAGLQQDLVALVHHEAICLDGFYARTELLRRVSPDPKLGGTADSFWLGAILLNTPAPRVSFLPERTFVYRRNPVGLTATGIDARTLFNGQAKLGEISSAFRQMNRSRHVGFGHQAAYQSLRSANSQEALDFLRRSHQSWNPLIHWMAIPVLSICARFPNALGARLYSGVRLLDNIRSILRRRRFLG